MASARVAAWALVLASVVAGCSSSSSAGQPAGAGTATSPPAQACPSATPRGTSLPEGAPARVPHPATVTSAKRLPVSVKGESELQFTTAMPLSAAAAFVQKEYPAAGYKLVGGDSESHEADILWAHGKVHGKTRLSGAGCSTTWTVLTLPARTAVPDGQDSN